MHRRTVLRSLGLAATGGAAGTATGHPPPDGDGDATPAEAATDGEPLGALDLPSAHELVTSPDGHTAYVAAGAGVAFVDVVSPTEPRLIAYRTELLADSDAGPMQRVQEVAVSDDRLVAAGPAHPADGAQGVVVFDVSDREAPERVAAHELETGIHNCAFDGRYAYLAGTGRDNSPLVVLDIDTGDVTGTWSLLDADAGWSDVHPGLRGLHDVQVQDGRAYLAYWDAGTWIVDVADHADISLVARVRGRSRETLAGLDSPLTERREPPGNDHFVTVDDDASVLAVGGESWAVDDAAPGGPSGIELFDITDPADPVSLTTIEPPSTSDPEPGGVLTTAHNFELTDGRLYSAWYNGGVRVHDVREPSRPRELFHWRDASLTSFWTAQRGAGCFLATSTNANGGSDVTPGVYTFPDPAIDAAVTEAVGAGGDGFGIAAALAAAGLAAWRLGRR